MVELKGTNPKAIIFYSDVHVRDSVIAPVLKDLNLYGEDYWIVSIGEGKLSAAACVSAILMGLHSFGCKPICIEVGSCFSNRRAVEEFPCVLIDSVVEADNKLFDKLPEFILSDAQPDSKKVCYSQDWIPASEEEFSKALGGNLPSGGFIYTDSVLASVAFVCKELGLKLISVKTVMATLDRCWEVRDIAFLRAYAVLKNVLEKVANE